LFGQLVREEQAKVRCAIKGCGKEAVDLYVPDDPSDDPIMVCEEHRK
jgi:hypothetical protein